MFQPNMPNLNGQDLDLDYDVHFPILYIRKDLASKGITNLDIVSDQVYKLAQKKWDNKIYRMSDICVKKGSNTEVTIRYPDGSERNCIIWCINHYLGLNRHPEVIAKSQAALAEYGTGCGTSALSGGITELHVALAERLAKMTGKEKAILFSTGYAANLGAISTLAACSDVILSDKETHASIIDGCRLSGKKAITFEHNSVEDLENKLKEHAKDNKTVLVLVESIYSMSGDVSPLEKIVELKKKYKFYLYVDEAHSFGFYGEKGQGYCHQLGITDQVDFIMGTLSKATASIGGFVTCKAKHAMLLNYATNAYIFQASIPPASVATVHACLDIIERDPSIITHLHSQAKYFKDKVKALGFDIMNSNSPIVPVIIKDGEILSKMSDRLIAEGVYSVPVTYPAVPKGETRFRFIVSATHTKQQIDHTIKVLEKLGKEYGII